MSTLSTTDPQPSGNVGGTGNAGAPPTGSVNDLFAQLNEFSWKGVSFPTSEFEDTLRQDLVIHRMADRNGGYVEGTGRHPYEITAQIPFLNHIYAAPSETWPQGALYPYQFRRFIKACLEGTSGPLVHPEYGALNCKIDLTKTKWAGKVRGGVWVTASWVESDDTQADQLGKNLSNASPITDLVANADNLDENIATLLTAFNAQQNPLPALQFSFSDLVRGVVGVIDSTTIVQKQFQGNCANLVYQANLIQGSIQRSPLGPFAWPLFQDCERVKAAAYDAAQNPTIASRAPILTKAILKDSTLSQAALFCGADITDFIVLNYALVATPVLPRGTIVRYYAATA